MSGRTFISRRRLAAAIAVASVFVFAQSAQAGIPIISYGGGVFEAGGAPSTLAGAHPFVAENTVVFETTPQEVGPGVIEEVPTASPKNVISEQPLGLVGAPAGQRFCSNAEYSTFNFSNGAETSCPDSSAVGIAEVKFPWGITNFSPVYNLVPPPGQVAEFGFKVSLQAVRLVATVGYRPGQGYGVYIGSTNISQGLSLKSTRIQLWGVPADPVHNSERGFCEGAGGPTGAECPAGVAPVGFLRNPTSCDGPLKTGPEATSWQEPTAITEAGFESPGMEGCGGLPFAPRIVAQPTSKAADSPTGLKVDVEMPQAGFENPSGRAESDLEGAVVTLPEGMTVNPSSANGQAGCSEAEIGLDQPTVAATCPAASKIGTVTVKTPLLKEPLSGSVYLARQRENRFGSLLAVYVAIEDPQTGVVIKLPGKVEPSSTGRLTARFLETPQLPFEGFELEFFGGPHAPLVNPPSCGTYATKASFTPWSGSAPVTSEDSFKIESGPNGGPCPSGAFEPKFSAGTTNPVAGSYSAFTLRVAREDGTQRLQSIAAGLPEGLLAKLAGVPYCRDSALASIPGAEGTGAAQIANPSCPAASQVGTVTVGSGAGPDPFFVQTGKAYLAGPYKGAPLSLAIVTPAVAGPFDLGNVVVRTALQVDPITTRVTAVSDPLPTSLHGIQLDLRDVRIDLNRESFIVNPTSCEPMRIGATIGSVSGASASPSSRFQVGSCASLAFKPKLALKLSGATRRGGNPALQAVLTQPKGANANIGGVSVVLPRSEFIDQAHVGNTCTRVQFNENACPEESILGTARAFSPLLEKPLEGPVYFRSNGGERKLPDLVADLNGQIHVVLVGFIDSVHQKGSDSSRIRTRFQGVPDAPVSKFVLNLKGGSRGLLENSANLCQGAHRAAVSMTGQNGKPSRSEPPVKVTCGGKAR